MAARAFESIERLDVSFDGNSSLGVVEQPIIAFYRLRDRSDDTCLPGWVLGLAIATIEAGAILGRLEPPLGFSRSQWRHCYLGNLHELVDLG